ncbi:rhomboid family intramembrane serine protease [Angustibacter aerolatus]
MTQPAAQQTEPVCPRHPDRVTYVRCQRCERPACPECQRQAAVGVQCVDCVREQARASQQVRTVLGGRAVRGRPVVTLTIIGLCAAAFLAQLGLGVTDRFDLWIVAVRSEPYRLLTSAFLHSTSFVPHILFNMWALYQVGPALEQVLGRARFAALYLVCALGGSAGYLLMVARGADPESLNQSAVGASGAVFGLFGALLVVQRRLGRADTGLLSIIGINLVIGFVVPGIAWQAHLGGLATGAALGAVLAYAPASRRAVVQWSGTALVLLVVLAVTWAKVLSLPQFPFSIG